MPNSLISLINDFELKVKMHFYARIQLYVIPCACGIRVDSPQDVTVPSSGKVLAVILCKTGLKSGSHVGIIFEASLGRSGKQVQEHNSPNFGRLFSRAL